MPDSKYKCLLISDFTIDNLAGLLSNDPEPPIVETSLAPFDQVMPVLLDEDHECWKRQYDLAVVWTQLQAVVESFNALMDYEKVDIETLLAQVDQYCAALSILGNRVRFAFVPTWVLPSYNRGLGMLDMKPKVGISRALMQMNLRLSENLESVSNMFVLDAQRWIAQAGPRAFNPKLWYMGKIPFGDSVFEEAVRDVKAAISGLEGAARKLIIVDLDDTLWGGIVGDDGWENLRLGGHDFVGEAYVDFQRALKALSNRGILLGIVSKNEESVALEAIEKHPEMVLRLDDFAGWRINWDDKAQNIVELVEELNLGLQSVVFLDDNPLERARVAEALPEALVPEMPQDKMLFPGSLLSLRCFDAPTLSQEDTDRSRMYVSERKRQDMKTRVGSLDDWLKGLNTEVKIEALNESDLERTTQLLNKTNQMNLTTRRMTERELVAWAQQDNHRLWTVRVSDKFGDSGLTGIMSLEVDGDRGRIVDFVLSCRVMGRKVEETMVNRVYEHARSVGLAEIQADYIPTRKNKPCLDFWMRSGFEYDETLNRFSWPVERHFPLPDSVAVELAE